MSSGKIDKKRLSEKRLFLADFFAHRVMDLPLRGVVTSDDLSNEFRKFWTLIREKISVCLINQLFEYTVILKRLPSINKDISVK